MNTRYNVFEVTCECKQVPEVVSCLFHTILFHRTYGKFSYKHDSSYSIGTLGFEEVHCTSIDKTYIRCSSPSLKDVINREIVEFSEKLRILESSTPLVPCCGSISLEFYMKSPRWKFGELPLTWEVWTIRLNCDKGALPNAPKVEDVLLEKILSIIQTVNSDKFLPPAPNQQQERNIFDVLHHDAQPYLFKVQRSIGTHMPSGSRNQLNSGGQAGPDNKIVPSPSTLKQFLRDAFNF